MTNRQKIIISMPFYLVASIVAGIIVSLIIAVRAAYETYKTDETVLHMWNELNPFS